MPDRLVVEYGGLRWRQRADGYLVHDAKRGGRRVRQFLHRRVYSDHHGPIPEGFDIHHRDEDKANNDIGNLEMLSHSEHLRRHAIKSDLGRRHTAAAQASLLAYRASERDVRDFTCMECGRGFRSRVYRSAPRFCSAACQDRRRDREFAASAPRSCKQCGTLFTPHRRGGYWCPGPCERVYRERRRAERAGHGVV